MKKKINMFLKSHGKGGLELLEDSKAYIEYLNKMHDVNKNVEE